MKFNPYLLLALTGATFFFACKKDKVTDVGFTPRPVTTTSNSYVTDLFEFTPGPGQFINTSLGNEDGAKTLLGKKGTVSLGAWGGFIVLGFDHTVMDQSGEDLIIYGNASTILAEPGVVWVMQDLNGNGKPDDIWYELAGSETGKTGYVKDYEVTYTRPDPAGDVAWKDNQGKTGFVKTNVYHKQAYFPEWISGNEYTLKGILLPAANVDMTNPALITSAPFAFGYADNTPGGDRIDIANAIDKEGKKVQLSGIDFIKIQTGIQADMGWIGELSTEVTGVADISLLK